MFDGIRLILVTDDRAVGAKYLLGAPVSLYEVPDWCLVTNDPAVILNIPADIPANGYFQCSPNHPAILAWDQRRAEGHVEGYSAATLERIARWQEAYREKERALAYEHLTPDGALPLAAVGAPDDRRASVDASVGHLDSSSRAHRPDGLPSRRGGETSPTGGRSCAGDTGDGVSEGQTTGAPAPRDSAPAQVSPKGETTVSEDTTSNPAWQGKQSKALGQPVNARAPDGAQEPKKRVSKWT